MKYCAFVLVLVVVVGLMSQAEAGNDPPPPPPPGSGGPNVGHQLQFAKIHPGKQAGCRDGSSTTARPTTAEK